MPTTALPTGKSLAQHDGGRSELLFAVHPIFAGTLPSVLPSLQKRNEVKLLRYETNLLPVAFESQYVDCMLSNEAFNGCCKALDIVLSLLEDRTNANVLKETPSSHSPKDQSNPVSLCLDGVPKISDVWC